MVCWFSKFLPVVFILSTWALPAQNVRQTPFERDTNYSATYAEVIDYYQQLAGTADQIRMQPFGMTDSGFPLHEIILSANGVFDPGILRQQNKLILFINNGIHAGEPCGVDASMMFVRDLLEGKIDPGLWQNVVVVLIPFYNIGGALNRDAFSRANQNGPAEHGFRGNARNLDLNRDFIKSDSKNAQSFQQLFCKWDPDVFLDNHTTNGADYPYIMTIVESQKDKASPPLGDYMRKEFFPEIYRRLTASGYPAVPYVNVENTPDQGIFAFFESPRFGSGYAALHHTIAMISEAHMLKTFAQRVRGAYSLEMHLLEILTEQGSKIRALREEAKQLAREQQDFPVAWELDLNQKDSILFSGYEATYKPSLVTGQKRMYYDHSKPYRKYIPFYNTYIPSRTIHRPEAYLLPQAYDDIIDRLRWNGVQMRQLTADTTLELEMYSITDFRSPSNPYEGHYLHTKVAVLAQTRSWNYHKGDYVIPTDQPAVRFIIETLEPEATDSYFAWNYFDAILGQKEYFSSYVFEDTAADLLAKDPQLAAEFEAKKQADADFAANARAQLNFVYQHSPYYEKTFRLYPVGRILRQ
ncbi:MAG: M14 family metallopeptidase [Saprospiraceae bacterium]|nr:M14 family metallopeptidase [Saprospiraceae bacterium]MCB9321848.1 M14 family metallopeptidase [Lewinellaceae bacterium]